MAKELDVNEVVNKLLDQVAAQYKEIVWLRLQLELLTGEESVEETHGD